jgi:hypothetical protein
MEVATVLRLNATRFDFSAMRLCSHHRETVFAFLRRFQFESNSFSCGFRSGECQNSEERAAMIAQAIPTTTVKKRAHSSCMNPPALNTRCKPRAYWIRSRTGKLTDGSDDPMHVAGAASGTLSIQLNENDADHSRIVG